ncbi:hypothetical protein LTR85_003963 [Meristemomyces frigidus]|nr:hypothetical protein LTR85_003963 [Meristemomyces frigidus]
MTAYVGAGASWLDVYAALDPLPTVWLEHAAGNDSLGTGPDDGNSIILLLSGLWPEYVNDSVVHAKATELMSAIDAMAKDMGLLEQFVYSNYADWTRQPLKSYGEDNLNSLRRTARKYDPHSVFYRRVPGGFKVPYH